MKVNDFYVSIRHTAKVEIDPKSHKLPPDYGPFKEFKVSDYFCPSEWSNNGYFIPVEEGMPLWIDLRFNPQCACVLSVQRFNPICNEPANLEEGLKKDPKQNYLVLPDQRWIDGYTRDGKVYQFVVTKAGEGLAVNEYVLPKEMQDSHAIGLAFFLPKNLPTSRNGFQPNQIMRPDVIDGRIDPTAYQLGPNWYSPLNTPHAPWFSPVHSPVNWQIRSKSANFRYGSSTVTRGEIQTSSVNCVLPDSASADYLDASCAHADTELVESSLCDSDSVDLLEQMQEDFDKASMGAGGRIEQEIITDPNTVEYYQEKPSLVLPIYLALPEQFEHIMKQGRRQDAHRADKYICSGEIGGVQVPLVK